MTELVLDCSVTMSWCFEDEATPTGDRVLEILGDDTGEAVGWVPPIWVMEVANVLLVAERRKRLRPADSTSFVQLVHSLPILVAPQVPTLEAGLLSTGRQYQLSAYDACYLQLALDRGIPLATADKALRRAAKKAGVVVFDA